jgi:hypothetical protein
MIGVSILHSLLAHDLKKHGLIARKMFFHVRLDNRFPLCNSSQWAFCKEPTGPFLDVDFV